ncbi:MAG: Arc family DNA-binding protein [Alicyclobacillus sp.]|nr:Arc family DNA-binding protein [Alicyclobacillus sp.]
MAETQQARLRGKEITSIHLRLPTSLHELLAKSAAENHRSLNAEALVILERYLYEKYGKPE